MKRLEGEVLDTARPARRDAAPPRPRQASPSTRTSSSASRSTRAPPPSPTWCSGSATCNGTSAPTTAASRRSPSCKNFQQHRMPRRRARLRRIESVPTNAGKTVTHWDGRTHEDPPRHRRAGARRNRPRPAPTLPQPAPRRVAEGRLHRRQSAFHRHRSACATPSATATSKPCAPPLPTCPIPPTSSCTGGTRPPTWSAPGEAPPLRLHHHEQPATRPSTAASLEHHLNANHRYRSPSPSPITRGWTPPDDAAVRIAMTVATPPHHNRLARYSHTEPPPTATHSTSNLHQTRPHPRRPPTSAPTSPAPIPLPANPVICSPRLQATSAPASSSHPDEPTPPNAAPTYTHPPLPQRHAISPTPLATVLIIDLFGLTADHLPQPLPRHLSVTTLHS